MSNDSDMDTRCLPFFPHYWLKLYLGPMATEELRVDYISPSYLSSVQCTHWSSVWSELCTYVCVSGTWNILDLMMMGSTEALAFVNNWGSVLELHSHRFEWQQTLHSFYGWFVLVSFSYFRWLLLSEMMVISSIWVEFVDHQGSGKNSQVFHDICNFTGLLHEESEFDLYT